jgi:hypothetical protein
VDYRKARPSLNQDISGQKSAVTRPEEASFARYFERGKAAWINEFNRRN